jgi:hypothetical protein
VSPTAGGIMAAIGGIAGLGVHVATGGGRAGSAVTLLVAGGCYLLASLVARTMPRPLLGPVREPGDRPPGRVLGEFALMLSGLAAGARYVLRRRGPAATLGATGANRFLYGILFLMSILLYRNYFYRSAGANTALSHYTVLVIASALGYACAALITPKLTKVLSKPAWITVLLAAGAVISGPLGETFNQVAFLIIGFGLNLVGQGVAICATTILQEEVDDEYRGRVFSFYDMMFNITFVAGAALSAAFMPVTGRSAAIIGLVAVGYAVAAAAYWLAARRPSPEDGNGQPSSSGAGGAPSPSRSAQRRSS